MKTRGFRRVARLSIAALALTSALGGAANAQCEQQVQQTLQRLGVSQDEVETLRIKKLRFGDPDLSDNNYDYNAWLRLRSCDSGHLVIHMSRTCYVRDSYTSGDCQVAGVPSY